MAFARVRYRPETESSEPHFEVVGHGCVKPWVASYEVLRFASAASLRAAVRRQLDIDGPTRLMDYEQFGVSRKLGPNDDPDDSLDVESVLFNVRPKDEIEVLVLGPPLEHIIRKDLMRLVEPVLRRRRCSRIRIAEHEEDGGSFWGIYFIPPMRGKCMGDLFDVGQDVVMLLEAVADGQFGPSSIADLIHAGRPDLLLGVSESDWLEVKSAPYDLGDVAHKIELAQDVARFANAESAAALVVGLKTRKRAGREVITSLAAISLGRLQAQRYRDVIDARVFPPIVGLRVETVALDGDKGVLVIQVPQQEEKLKPFLVHGALVARRVEGAFISIVRRRGEASIPVTAKEIHSMLAAGRSLLRGTSRRRSRSQRK